MSPSPFTIGRKQPLSEAHELMREHGVRHLPVVDGGVLVGLVSQRDLHLVETLKDVDPTEVPVEDAMTEAPYVVAPDARLDLVAFEMAGNRLGSAVVVVEGSVVGLFTTTDALRVLVALLRERRALDDAQPEPEGVLVGKPSSKSRASARKQQPKAKPVKKSATAKRSPRATRPARRR